MAKFDSNTTISTILSNADMKAVLDRHVPGLADNPMIGMAGGMTLDAIKSFMPDDAARAKLDDAIKELTATFNA